MSDYFAYHSKENSEPFDVADGYGFEESAKLKKLNKGDIVYIIQKLKGWSHFVLCGRYKIAGKYEDFTHFKNRPHRIQLEGLSKLNEPIPIDEAVWSNLLSESGYKYNWSNFKKHFCKEGASLQLPLSEHVTKVIENFIGEVENHDLAADIELINNDSDLGRTERERLIKSRLGQGKFKKNVKATRELIAVLLLCVRLKKC